MIEKLITINNVGKFRRYGASGDLTMRRLTLIYGQNGRGKTTLAGILRSLRTGRPEYIDERRTLGGMAPTGEPEVIVRLGGRIARFGNRAWSESCSQIEIFDTAFVHQNVYAGDCVQHEHRKRLYRVIVGEEGVRLAQQIDTLDAHIRDLNGQLRDKEDSLLRLVRLPEGISLEQFLALPTVENIDEEIKLKAEELAAQEMVTKKATEIQHKPAYSTLSLPSLPTSFRLLMERTMESMASDAEELVRQHVQEHLDSRGETWLAQGAEYSRGTRCPFCGQELTASALIAAYRSYFSEQYRQFKDDLVLLERQIEQSVGDAAILAVLAGFTENKALAEFWKQFFSADLPELPMDQIRERYSRLREESLEMIRRKYANLPEAVSAHPAFDAAEAEVQALGSTLATYNEAVVALNARIALQKQASQTGDSGREHRRQLEVYRAVKARHEPNVEELCAAVTRLRGEKSTADGEKTAQKESLDRYCTNVLRGFESRITDYLREIGSGFRIARVRHDYQGGTPRCQFQIVVNGVGLDAGESSSAPGNPCFGTVLSAGDRGALALAFFLAVLDRDPALDRKIVILDDPFSSLDRFRRIWTKQTIQRLARTTEQVIVMAHDPLFLRLLTEDFQASEIKTLQIGWNCETSFLSEWDLEAETGSSYIQDYGKLLKYYRERTGEPRSVARAIRPFLESFMRVHFPGHFADNEWLGQFLDKVRASQPGSPLEHAKTDLTELEAINGYSKRYHHDTSLSAETEPIQEDELLAYVERTLKFVGGC